MKATLRMLALLLAMAMVFSCFVIAGSAAAADDEAEEEESEADLPVYYNRTYDEAGMDVFAGLTTVPKAGKIQKATESAGVDMLGMPLSNTYIQLLAAEDYTGVADSNLDTYFETKFNVSDKDIVVEFSFRKIEGKPVPTSGVSLTWVYYNGTNARSFMTFGSVAGDGSVKLSANGAVIATLSETEWCNVAFVFDIEGETVSAYNNGVAVAENVSFPWGSGFNYAENLRVQMAKNVANAGAGLAVDNFRVYNGTHIREFATDGTTELPEVFDSSVVMKVNTAYALVEGEQNPIADDNSVTPIEKDGTVYVPFAFLATALGYTVAPVSSDTLSVSDGTTTALISIGNDSAYIGDKVVVFESEYSVINVNGQVMTTFEVIETVLSGYYVSYDEMGLFAVSEEQNILDRDADPDTLILVLNTLIYDNPTGDDIYADALAYAEGELSHPRLIVSADQFAAARAAYASGDSSYVNLWAKALADRVLDEIETVADPVYGYDDGDRMSGKADVLADWAFAYQMLKEADAEAAGKIADRTLKYVYALSQFDDWNPGYSPDAAGISMAVALVYDWMYDAWAGSWSADSVAALLGQEAADTAFLRKEDGSLDVVRFMEDTLYYYGVASLVGSYNSTEYQMTSQGMLGRGAWRGYESSLNAVSNSGYMVACLALMDVERPLSENTVPTHINKTFNGNQITGSANFGTLEYAETEYDFATLTVGGALPALTSSNAFCTDPTQTGLTYASEIRNVMTKMMESIKIALQSYVPDGSYAEGPSAWSDATNGIYVMMQALMSATGNHYGILYAGGLDVTPYYALQMESQSGIMWNYHDSMGSIDTSYLGWAGEMFGDAALAAQHYKAVVAGEKAASYLDILYFDESLLEGGAELDLDAYLAGIDTAVFRSDWSADGVYAGLHGGQNGMMGSDLDAGNFIYDSCGIRWFVDLGSDNQNLPGYSEFTADSKRWSYYRKSAEGQNTIVISSDAASLPYGQSSTASAQMVDFYSDENGGYAVLDMAPVLGGSGLVTSAERGLLFTNSRKTVVIQDEIVFSKAASLYWVAHINAGENFTIELAEYSTVAYLTYTEGNTQYTVRATIVPMSPAYSYLFRVMDASALLAATTGATDPEGPQENSRSDCKKLVIESKNTMHFGCAVVIETIESKNLETGYTYTITDNWMPVADTRPDPEPDDVIDDTTVTLEDVEAYLDAFTAATGDAKTEAMLQVARGMKKLSDADRTALQNNNQEAYSAFVTARDAYDADSVSVNNLLSQMLAVGGSLTAKGGDEAACAAGKAGS